MSEPSPRRLPSRCATLASESPYPSRGCIRVVVIPEPGLGPAGPSRPLRPPPARPGPPLPARPGPVRLDAGAARAGPQVRAALAEATVWHEVKMPERLGGSAAPAPQHTRTHALSRTHIPCQPPLFAPRAPTAPAAALPANGRRDGQLESGRAGRRGGGAEGGRKGGCSSGHAWLRRYPSHDRIRVMAVRKPWPYPGLSRVRGMTAFES